MAVIEGTVSLVVHSTSRSAAWFTEQTELHPTHSSESDSPEATDPRYRRRDFSVWVLDVHYDEDTNTTLDDAVLALLSQLDDKQEALSRVAGEVEMRVQFYGSSNSSQGGFDLGPESLLRLGRFAELGGYLWGTVYVDDPSE